jgi:hypothetical protein
MHIALDPPAPLRGGSRRHWHLVHFSRHHVNFGGSFEHGALLLHGPPTPSSGLELAVAHCLLFGECTHYEQYESACLQLSSLYY